MPARPDSPGQTVSAPVMPPGSIAGVLNLAKPTGMTSHDVVAAVRRMARLRSVGHAGTLDPLASGVLVILLGRATVLAPYVTAGLKVYRADVAFGSATTTDDAEGEVCREAPVPLMTTGEFEVAFERFVGTIDQVPPRFSAIKKDGKRAYAEARQGRDPGLASRLVSIHAIRLLEWRPPHLKIEVACGPGTYLRSLARDLGEALDSAAHLAGLVRCASGRFRLDQAVPLDRLTPENLFDHLLPMDVAVDHLRSATLTASEAVRARHGALVSVPMHPESDGEVIRLHDPDGRLLALARPSGPLWHPFRVLDPAEAS